MLQFYFILEFLSIPPSNSKKREKNVNITFIRLLHKKHVQVLPFEQQFPHNIRIVLRRVLSDESRKNISFPDYYIKSCLDFRHKDGR